MNKHYEIQYTDGRVESTKDEAYIDQMIDDLEMYERYDVNMITINTDDGEFVEMVWTEEEGLYHN